MSSLTHRLERSVVIQAPREAVFRFFTDSARWAKWWGAGSTIEARVGGQVFIQNPRGVKTLGEVLELSPPSRIVLTYGYASGKPIGPGESRVTISLEECSAGTRLHLLHEFADAAARDQHVQGWRFQLSLFANAVADEIFAESAKIVDAWYDAWNTTADQDRDAKFARITMPDVNFRDRFSLLDSQADLSAHAGAGQRFMPGMHLQRKGETRQCQGMVIADWTVLGPDGQERMSGTSVFVLAPDGRISSATGFANPTR
jgi:uncharacterized protein YndB with AHSA1/START domain